MVWHCRVIAAITMGNGYMNRFNSKSKPKNGKKDKLSAHMGTHRKSLRNDNAEKKEMLHTWIRKK